MKKLTCHCGGIEAEVNVPENGFQKIMRCNCSICKRKGYIIGVLGPDDFSLVKGEDLLTLYQFKTKTAQHYFCPVFKVNGLSGITVSIKKNGTYNTLGRAYCR